VPPAYLQRAPCDRSFGRVLTWDSGALAVAQPGEARDWRRARHRIADLAGFRMCRLRAAAFGDCRDGLAPHPQPLRKWFAAAWQIGQDKRGVSALFLARELALRYDTAWLMAHKLRHGLSERPEYPFKPGSGISGLVRFSPNEATRWVVRCVPQTRAQALRGRADGSPSRAASRPSLPSSSAVMPIMRTTYRSAFAARGAARRRPRRDLLSTIKALADGAIRFVRCNSSRCWRDCTGRPFGDSQELSRFWQGDRIIRRRPDDGR
jgi:hypothetical protein